MDDKKLDLNSPTVHAYLSLLQGAVNAMRNNSAICKTLCITLVAAVGAIGATAQKPKVLLISIIPILICGLLDIFYLSLEKAYRQKYNEAVEQAKASQISDSAIFNMTPPREYISCKFCLTAFKSWSVWPVYCGTIAIISFTYLLS